MYNKEKRLYDIEMSSYVGASSQVPGYLQQEESTQNELATYLEQDNNVSNHHDDDDDESCKNDISGEVKSPLITTETTKMEILAASDALKIVRHRKERTYAPPAKPAVASRL